jgi:hypothetical protein
MNNPFFSKRRGGDSNPRYPIEYASLANWWIKPLSHLSCRIMLKNKLNKSIKLNDIDKKKMKILTFLN